MRLGISTYTYTWAVGVPGYPLSGEPMTAVGLLEKAGGHGVDVVQICDNLPLHTMDLAALERIKKAAETAGIILEIGTRGIEPHHLFKYLEIAQFLNAKLVRTILQKDGEMVLIDRAVSLIQEVLPEFEAKGIYIAVENHEKHSVKDLAHLMEKLGSAYAGELALRDDCTFVATHPCHPALFYEQENDEARRDFFGGIAVKQDIVIALVQGKEELFEKVQKVCSDMFAPVVKCHRITVEQMALLEPAAAEVIIAAAATLMKEAYDEVVKRGVPEEAAKSFLLGHTQIPLAIAFKVIPSPFSDGAKIAINIGHERVFKENWKDVFEPEVVKDTVSRMLHPEKTSNINIPL